MRHNFLRLSLAGFAAYLLAAFAPPASLAQQAPSATMDPSQVEAIEQIVRDYLLRNPEIVIEAAQAYQEKRKIAEAERQREAVASLSAVLMEDPDSPVIGNSEGDVTLVEFFDYRCPYCRRMAPDVLSLIESDPGVRVVMKEYPILGPESVEGARAALAAARQGKYQEFHFALIMEPGDMSEAHIMATAEQVGIDTEQLRRDMQSSEINQMLARNRELGDALGITGTPALVVGGQVVPGAINLLTLKSLISQARANSS